MNHECIVRGGDIVDNFAGLEIKALYKNGWLGGKLNYYKKSLEEYQDLYEDKTKD